MKDLSELSMRALAELEEAGEEDVPTLLNAVTDVKGNYTEVDEFKTALNDLCDRDMIRMSISREYPSGRLLDSSKDRSHIEIEHISSFLSYAMELRRWLDDRRVAPPFETLFPIVVLTDKGFTSARELLTERGYQWWRPIRK